MADQTPDLPETDLTKLPAELPAGLTLLDVREDDEWAAGHIAGATHIPMNDVPDRLAEVTAAAGDDQILVICRAGGRSARVTGFLVQQGVDAVNLAGGMQAWASAGRAMTSESGSPAEVI